MENEPNTTEKHIYSPVEERRVAVLTFTCWKDAHRAVALHNNIPTRYLASNGVKLSLERVWAIESKDNALAGIAGIPECKIVVSDFPRNRGCSGIDAIMAMRALYLQLLSKYDFVLKLDSDSRIFDWGGILEPMAHNQDFIGALRLRNEYHGRRPNGCCYAFGRKVANALRNTEVFSRAVKDTPEYLPEDVFFGGVFSQIPDLNICDLDKNRTFMCCRPYLKGDCFMGHFGYLSDSTTEARVLSIETERAFYDPNMIKFEGVLGERFMEEQKKIAPERKIAVGEDLYKDNGEDTRPLPAGSLLLGYLNEKPIWRTEGRLVASEGLTPYPESFMAQNRIGKK